MQSIERAFAEKHPGAVIFARGRLGAAVLAAVEPHRLVLKIAGTAYSETLIDLLKEIRTAGHLASDDFCAMIDLTEFTGAIDWEEIRKISDVMPKGQSRNNRNAYVVHDNYLAMIAKITSALFPQTECAAFSNEKDARTWLKW